RVSNRVTHEHDASFIFGGRSDFCVGFAIAGEFWPVFERGIHFGNASLGCFEVVAVAGRLRRGGFGFRVFGWSFGGKSSQDRCAQHGRQHKFSVHEILRRRFYAAFAEKCERSASQGGPYKSFSHEVAPSIEFTL